MDHGINMCYIPNTNYNQDKHRLYRRLEKESVDEAKIEKPVQIKHQYFTEPLWKLGAGVFRLVVLCDLHAVEDELHFVFHCPLYYNLGITMFDRLQDNNPDSLWCKSSLCYAGCLRKGYFLSRYLERAWDTWWKCFRQSLQIKVNISLLIWILSIALSCLLSWLLVTLSPSPLFFMCFSTCKILYHLFIEYVSHRPTSKDLNDNKCWGFLRH